MGPKVGPKLISSIRDISPILGILLLFITHWLCVINVASSGARSGIWMRDNIRDALMPHWLFELMIIDYYIIKVQNNSDISGICYHSYAFFNFLDKINIKWTYFLWDSTLTYISFTIRWDVDLTWIGSTHHSIVDEVWISTIFYKSIYSLIITFC